jgi:hypothetical protein
MTVFVTGTMALLLMAYLSTGVGTGLGQENRAFDKLYDGAIMLRAKVIISISYYNEIY